jgi:hypothetical protein
MHYRVNLLADQIQESRFSSLAEWKRIGAHLHKLLSKKIQTGQISQGFPWTRASATIENIKQINTTQYCMLYLDTAQYYTLYFIVSLPVQMIPLQQC